MFELIEQMSGNPEDARVLFSASVSRSISRWDDLPESTAPKGTGEPMEPGEEGVGML